MYIITVLSWIWAVLWPILAILSMLANQRTTVMKSLSPVARRYLTAQIAVNLITSWSTLVWVGACLYLIIHYQ